VIVKMKKTNYLKRKISKKEPTLTPDQEELSNLEVRNPEGNNEEVSVTENLLIVLRNGKRLRVKYLIFHY